MSFMTWKIIWLLPTYLIVAQKQCTNGWSQINDNCMVYEEISTTMALQILDDSAYGNLSSYSSASIQITAKNKNLIMTPHCLSFDNTLANNLSLHKLPYKWISQLLPWPLHHVQGTVVTFNFNNISKNISFPDVCHIKKDETNAIMLIFSHNFNAYNIEITQCGNDNNRSHNHNTHNTDDSIQSMTMYDRLCTSKLCDDENGNCSLPIKYPYSWNFKLFQTLSTIENSNLSTTQQSYEKQKYNKTETETETFIVMFSSQWLIYLLLAVIILCNVSYFALIWCYNQQKLQSKVKEIKEIKEIHAKYPAVTGVTATPYPTPICLSPNSALSSYAFPFAIAMANNDSGSDAEPAEPDTEQTEVDDNNNNNNNNNVYNLSLSGVDEIINNDKNILKELNLINTIRTSNHMHYNYSLSKDDEICDKLQILMSTLGNIEIGSSELECGKIQLHNLHVSKLSHLSTITDKMCIILNESGYDYNINNNSNASTRLPAYHPNTIQVMNDNQHIPYCNNFVTAGDGPNNISNEIHK